MASVMASVGNRLIASRLRARPPRQALLVSAVARPSVNAVAGGTVVWSAALVQASPALAEASTTAPSGQPVDVDSAIDQLIAAVKAAGTAIKSGGEVVGNALDSIEEGYENAEPYLRQGYSTVAPLVQQAVDATGQAVRPVYSAVAPILKGSVDDAIDAVEHSGFHVSDVVGPVTSVAQTAIAIVVPLTAGFARFVTSTPPTLLAEYAVGALALYLLAPTLAGALSGSFRGYAGEISASAAADLLLNGNATLVDLRSQKEKETSGVPDLPSGARDKVQDVEYALTDGRRLRGLLRDPTAIERKVTALQVAALRRVDKGSTVLLLDRYGGNSTAVAKELAAKGYTKVFVIAGGFDGRLGWVQSKLQIKPAASEISGILAPAPRIGTRRQLSAPR